MKSPVFRFIPSLVVLPCAALIACASSEDPPRLRAAGTGGGASGPMSITDSGAPFGTGGSGFGTGGDSLGNGGGIAATGGDQGTGGGFDAGGGSGNGGGSATGGSFGPGGN